MSLKLTGESRVITIKNDAKFEKELILTKVCNV